MFKESTNSCGLEGVISSPVNTLLQTINQYTNEQWWDIQKHCWKTNRSELDSALGKDDAGYEVNGYYLNFTEEQDLKTLKETLEKHIRHLQASKKAYRPIFRGPWKKILSLDNFTRFFLAQKAAWVCSVAIGEVQLKGLSENQDLHLLGVFIDNQNHLLTRQRLQRLTFIPPKS